MGERVQIMALADEWSVGMGEMFTIYVEQRPPYGGEVGFLDEAAALRYAIDLEKEQRDRKTRNTRYLRRRLTAASLRAIGEGL